MTSGESNAAAKQQAASGIVEQRLSGRLRVKEGGFPAIIIPGHGDPRNPGRFRPCWRIVDLPPKVDPEETLGMAFSELSVCVQAFIFCWG